MPESLAVLLPGSMSFCIRCVRQSAKMAVWLPSDFLLAGSRRRPRTAKTHQIQHQAQPMPRKRAFPRQTETREERQLWWSKIRQTRRDRNSKLLEGRHHLFKDLRWLRWAERAVGSGTFPLPLNNRPAHDKYSISATLNFSATFCVTCAARIHTFMLKRQLTTNFTFEVFYMDWKVRW